MELDQTLANKSSLSLMLITESSSQQRLASRRACSRPTLLNLLTQKSFRDRIVPPPQTEAWGKARCGQVPHPLACHILETAAVERLVFPLVLHRDCAEKDVVVMGLFDLGPVTVGNLPM